MAIRANKFDIDTFVNDKIGDMLTEYAKKQGIDESQTNDDDLSEEFFGMMSPIHDIARELADFIEEWGNAQKRRAIYNILKSQVDSLSEKYIEVRAKFDAAELMRPDKLELQGEIANIEDNLMELIAMLDDLKSGGKE